MEDVISLVLIAMVVAVGIAGLFGRRPHRPAAAGGARSGDHRLPPSYRIVRPSGVAGPPMPIRPMPTGPLDVPAGPVGVHDGATRLMPAVPVPDDDDEGPDPDAELLARGRPSGGTGPVRRVGPAGSGGAPSTAGPPGPGGAAGPGGVWAPGRRP